MSARHGLLAAVLLAATSASAHDAGRSVTFNGERSLKFSAAPRTPGSLVVFESAMSDPVPESWRTVLVHGELPEPGLTLEARRPGAAGDGGAKWVPLEMHRYEGGRFWAKARMPEAAAGPLYLRALNAGAPGLQDAEIFSIEVFPDEPENPAPPRGQAFAPEAAPPPSPQRPPVHLRAEWKAVPPTQPYAPDPQRWRVTLHHSDGKYTKTLQESLAEAKFIQDFHIHGRGWIDIAYHFLVDTQGNIIEGRPENALGAHTLANNEGNIGICLLGTYHPPKNDKPTKAQLDAVAAIGRYLVTRYRIDPANLKGHRDYKSTDCPGDENYAKLDVLRKAFGGAPLPPDLKKHAQLMLEPLAWLNEPSWDGAFQRE